MFRNNFIVTLFSPFILTILQFKPQCEEISGLGFRRGSYKCVCKPGFYFPLHLNVNSSARYFNGSDLEEEYAKILEVRMSCQSVMPIYYISVCRCSVSTCA